MSSDGIAAQLTSTKGPLARLLFSCSQRDTTSLPVPFSPSISTRASVGATRSIISFTWRIFSELPTMSYLWLMRCLSSLVSAMRALRSVAFLITTSRRLRSSGFSIKSYAPFLIASTAVSTVPCPEIITTATSIFLAMISDSTSSPSILGILMSHNTMSKLPEDSFSKPSKPSWASSTSCDS